MRLEIILGSAATARSCVVEFPENVDASTAGGKLRFSLDGEAGQMDWAEITPGVYSLLLGGQSFEVRLRQPAGAQRRNGVYEVVAGPAQLWVEVRGRRSGMRGSDPPLGGPQEVAAPMPGRVIKLLVKEGQTVEKGAGLVVIEAMKMQNELRAPRPGLVERIYVREGEGVEGSAKLVRLV
ncbi:MAG: biotin/lipoyl-containing protein [Terriglobia bacterium]